MQFELYKGISVTEASDIDWNQGARLDCSVYKQFERIWHQNGYSDQEVRDKIGKNCGWAVCKSWSDVDNKKMCFEVLINAKASEVRTVDYDVICKDYGWKSFKWSEDGQTILPKK